MAKKNIIFFAFLLGVATIGATAYGQSADSLQTVRWLTAHNIEVNDPNPPEGYRKLRDCDSDIVYKKVSGDTIIYYNLRSYINRPPQYLEYILKKPYFNVTVYPKAVHADGTVTLVHMGFYSLLYRNDSLYALDKAGSDLYDAGFDRMSDMKALFEKQAENSDKNPLEALMEYTLQREDAAEMINLKGIDTILAGIHPAFFQLIYYKNMFRDSASRAIKKRNNYLQETTPYVKVTAEKKLEQDGMDCYLLSIRDEDLYGTLDEMGNMLVSADGRLLDLENCRVNKNMLMASVQSAKDSIAQTRVDSIFRKTDLAVAAGGNRSKSGFSTPYAQVGILHRNGIIDKKGKVIIPLQYDRIDVFSGSLAGVIADKKFRLVDSTGTVVSPVAYDYCGGYRNGMTAVATSNKWGLIDSSGKEVVPCIYEQVQTLPNGWLVKLHGKQGLLDAKFKEIMAVKYDNITPFSFSGLLQVRLAGKTGVFNDKGKEVIPMLYDGINELSDGAAAAMKNGKIGFVDSAGKEIIPFIYEAAEDFRNGLAKVYLHGKWGYTDKRNKIVIPLIFDDISEFDDDGVAVAAKNGLYGTIDRAAREIIPFRLESGFQFRGRFAVVDVGGQDGVIDRNGKQIVPLRYKSIQVDEPGNWIRVEWEERYGYYDTLGHMIVPVKYTNRTSKYSIVNGFSEGLVAVEVGGKWGYLDHKGKQVIPMIYDEAEGFEQGMAKIMLHGKYGYINRAGKAIIAARYDDINKFSDGWFAASLSGKWGFIDKNGKQMIPFRYDDVTYFYEGLSAVKLNGKYGYIDRQGNTVIPFMYDDAGNFLEHGKGY